MLVWGRVSYNGPIAHPFLSKKDLQCMSRITWFLPYDHLTQGWHVQKTLDLGIIYGSKASKVQVEKKHRWQRVTSAGGSPTPRNSFGSPVHQVQRGLVARFQFWIPRCSPTTYQYKYHKLPQGNMNYWWMIIARFLWDLKKWPPLFFFSLPMKSSMAA